MTENQEVLGKSEGAAERQSSNFMLILRAIRAEPDFRAMLYGPPPIIGVQAIRRGLNIILEIAKEIPYKHFVVPKRKGSPYQQSRVKHFYG
jgi:hypothetical protein